MRTYTQTWIITKTIFKAWIRYPENTVGTLIYLGIVGLFGYVLMVSGLLVGKAMPYYISGLTIYGVIGQANSVYLHFSLWREEILAKPIKPDIFLLGVFGGGLLTNALPMFLLFGLVMPFYIAEFTLDIGMLLLSIFLGILSSIGMSYFFASFGLRFRPEGFIVTALTFVFTFLCGILIPLYILPKPLIYVSYIIPYTWAIELFRHSLLTAPTILPVHLELLLLLISTIVYLILGRIFLIYTLKVIRIKKVIIK